MFMTFVKVIFVFLILIPVAILMWSIISRLIADFTECVKENAIQEREKATEVQRRDTKNFKQMIDKRKRRKARRKKKDKEQQK